ncbi:MAG: DUF488 family protein, N3 subclade [Fusobacteriaceae bacterium]
MEIGDWGKGTGLEDWLKEKHGTLYLSSVANAKFIPDTAEKIYIGQSNKCDNTFDKTFKDLAPTWNLVKYAKNTGKLDDYFKQEYKAQIKNSKNLQYIEKQLKTGKDICLICFCADSKECHRGIIGTMFESKKQYKIDWQESLSK